MDQTIQQLQNLVTELKDKTDCHTLSAQFLLKQPTSTIADTTSVGIPSVQQQPPIITNTIQSPLPILSSPGHSYWRKKSLKCIQVIFPFRYYILLWAILMVFLLSYNHDEKKQDKNTLNIQYRSKTFASPRSFTSSQRKWIFGLVYFIIMILFHKWFYGHV